MKSLIDVVVPDIGDFKDVEVIELLVKPGDTVKPEQSLITVESDKASMEIPSSAGGVVKELKVKLGDKVSQGSAILVLEASSATPAPPAAERAAAPVLFEALSDAAALARRGERDADVLRAEIARRIGSEPLAALDYVAVVDDATWDDVGTIAGPSRALTAARFGSTRLIDNLLLPWDA